MLFEGSEKYPDTGYFDEQVAKAGGYSNAYTSNTETVFYFSVGSESL
jgi:insulysin